MASGTIYGTTSNNYIDSKIVWSSTANEAGNYSTVKATLYYKRNNSGYTTSGTGTFSIEVNGSVQTVSSKHLSITSTLWVAALSGTWKVAHGSDGKKSVKISATGQIPSTTLQSTSCSATVTLDAIALAAQITSLTCSTGYFDGELTYKYTVRGSGTYIRAYFNLSTDTDFISMGYISHGSRTANTYTATTEFPETDLSDIYYELPNTTTAKIRVTIKTYSDANYSKQIGNDSWKEISLTIPTKIKPTSTLTVSPINGNEWIAEKKIYVAGYSGLVASCSATAGEGASMASYSIVAGDYSSSSRTLSVSKISDPGALEVKSTAKDSRGRSATANKTITVQPYSIPAITSLAVDRGTYSSGWTADDNGSDVRVVFRTVLSLTDYDNTYKATFQLDGSDTTPYAGTTTGLKSGTTYTIYFRNIDNEKNHTLKIFSTDNVGNSGSATIVIATANITIEFNVSGKGIAFGKTSEKDAFECAMDAEFSGTLAKKRSDGSLVEIDDTGWIELGLSANVSERDSAFGHAGKGCFYRVINGNHVYVAFACDVTYANAQLVVNANMIPQDYRPTRHIYGFSSTGGRAIARVIVNGSGQILIDYIQQIIATSNTTSYETWVDGYIDYWI